MHYRRRRWMRWALLYVAGVIAMVAAGLVLQAAFDPGSQKPEAFPPTSLPVPPWDTATVPPPPSPTATRAASAALTGPVQVVQGSQVVNGVYLGWPHSTVGAVSAAAELSTQILSTLDPDRAAAVMRLAADPTFTVGPQQAAEGVASVRKSLGLAASGPVPSGYSFEFSPAEYQVRDVSASRVTVLLLADAITATPGQGTQAGVEVFPVALAWAAGDWTVLPAPAASYASLAAEPGSPQAAALGWQQLLPIGG
jgi:hypothetical protein